MHITLMTSLDTSSSAAPLVTTKTSLSNCENIGVIVQHFVTATTRIELQASKNACPLCHLKQLNHPLLLELTGSTDVNTKDFEF